MARDRTYWGLVSGRPMDLVEKLRGQREFRHLVLTALALRPGDRVLDLGCGTGIHLPVLRDAVGPGGQVLAVDYSPRMVARAAARAAGWDNVVIERADATTAAFPAAAFDAVLASFSISATQDVPAVVAAVHSALRPGGRLFAPDMRLVPRGRSAPVTWALGLIYRLAARWTGVDVLDAVRARFGSAEVVDKHGRPLPALPDFAPVVMIAATKGGAG